jgi:hypothetical protein
MAINCHQKNELRVPGVYGSLEERQLLLVSVGRGWLASHFVSSYVEPGSARFPVYVCNPRKQKIAE